MDLVTVRDSVLLLYFGFLLSNIVTLRSVLLLTKTIVAAISVSAAYALIQLAVGIDLAAVIVPPLTRGGGQTLTGTLMREGMLRPPGAAGHPLELAFLIAAALPLALSLCFAERAQSHRVWPWWLCCAILGSGLMSALSRSAILGSVVALGVMACYWNRRRLKFVLTTGLGTGIAVFVVRPDLISAIFAVFATSSRDDSVQSRGRAIEYSIDMVVESPILGCGHGCLVEPFHPVLDDQFLGRLIEGGVIGLLSFAALLLAAAYKAARAGSLLAADGGPGEQATRDIAVGLAGSMSAIIVMNFVLDTTGFNQAWTLMWTLLALCWSVRRLAAKFTDEPYGLTSYELSADEPTASVNT